MLRPGRSTSLPVGVLVGVALVAACGGGAAAIPPSVSPEAPTAGPTTTPTPSMALEPTPSPSASPGHRHFAIGIPVFGPDGALYSTDCGAASSSGS